MPSIFPKDLVLTEEIKGRVNILHPDSPAYKAKRHQLVVDEQVFCRKCKLYSDIDGSCTKAKLDDPNQLIDGIQRYANALDVRTNASACGVTGQWFERIPPK